jgi:hypothetical protein
MAFKNDVADDMAPVEHPVWPSSGPRLAANHCKTIAKPLQNRCKIVAKPDRARRGPDKLDGPDGVPDEGLDEGPNKAKRGGGRKDYLL